MKERDPVQAGKARPTTRRRVLSFLLGATGLAAAAALPFRRSLLAALRLRVTGTNASPVLAALEEADMDTLLALGDVLMPSAFVGFEAMRPVVWEAPRVAAVATNPVPADSAEVARGRQVYEQNCGPCHGPSGTPQSTRVGGGAPDFADPGYARSRTDGEIFWKIGTGRGSMPGFEGALDAGDRWRVVRYVRSLSEAQASSGAGVLSEGRTPREVVARTIAERCRRNPEAAGTFRAAVELLDARSLSHQGRRFAELGLDERRAMIASLLEPYARNRLVRMLYHFSEYGRGVRGLWRLVCVPILTGFYTSSFGWRVVGYPRRRGDGSNLTDYQVPPKLA